jgi:hypothetical protein
MDSYSPIAAPINAQTSYAIFVPLNDNLAPSVFYTDGCMIRIKYHGWNKEIKRPDRPVGQRGRRIWRAAD